MAKALFGLGLVCYDENENKRRRIDMAIGDDENRYIVRFNFAGGGQSLDLRLCEPYGKTKKERHTAIKREITGIIKHMKYFHSVDLFHIGKSHDDFAYIGSKLVGRDDWYKKKGYFED